MVKIKRSCYQIICWRQQRCNLSNDHKFSNQNTSCAWRSYWSRINSIWGRDVILRSICSIHWLCKIYVRRKLCPMYALLNTLYVWHECENGDSNSINSKWNRNISHKPIVHVSPSFHVPNPMASFTFLHNFKWKHSIPLCIDTYLLL